MYIASECSYLLIEVIYVLLCFFYCFYCSCAVYVTLLQVEFPLVGQWKTELDWTTDTPWLAEGTVGSYMTWYVELRPPVVWKNQEKWSLADCLADRWAGWSGWLTGRLSGRLIGYLAGWQTTCHHELGGQQNQLMRLPHLFLQLFSDWLFDSLASCWPAGRLFCW